MENPRLSLRTLKGENGPLGSSGCVLNEALQSTNSRCVLFDTTTADPSTYPCSPASRSLTAFGSDLMYLSARTAAVASNLRSLHLLCLENSIIPQTIAMLAIRLGNTIAQPDTTASINTTLVLLRVPELNNRHITPAGRKWPAYKFNLLVEPEYKTFVCPLS